jgi:uncharacterized protein
MQFTLDARAGVNLIRAYSPRELTVGARTLTASCIVSADTLISEWRPASLAALLPEDLAPLLALEPEIVLIGAMGERALSSAVRAAFGARCIAVEVMDLGAACRTFNILVQEERRVAAALFLKGESPLQKAT